MDDNCQVKAVNQNLKPFLRWAGGKQSILKELLKHTPRYTRTYFEPFLGAGSLFFSKRIRNAFLSDINKELINSYTQLKNCPHELYEHLNALMVKHSKSFYYKMRDLYNREKNTYSTIQAARFIYLNHTSFNGIYRVNKNGEYNVPFGKLNPVSLTYEHFESLSNKLENATLLSCSYEKIIEHVNMDDFVYLDPPYPPISQTAFFRHYSEDRFPVENHLALRNFALNLSRKGAFVMITNADTPFIRQLFHDWKMFKIKTTRFISCKANRQKADELIIKNY